MAGVNKCIFVGNLGKDPDVRRLNNGTQVVSFPLAVSESWRDKQSGDRKEKTEWINIVIFNENIAKVAEQYLKKGMKVYVEGQMQSRKWQDGDGKDRYTTEIVLQRFRGELQMLSGKGEGGASEGDSGSSLKSSNEPRGGSYSPGPVEDDAIPFAPPWQ
jgi:single-strand DNA-binding protein